MNAPTDKPAGFNWTEFRMGFITAIIIVCVLKILIEVVNP